jgi:hypothetical protein
MTIKLTRDQERAAHAYKCVEGATAQLKEYKVLVNALGPNIVRSGFAASMAFLQRTNNAARDQFARDLASGFPRELQMGADLSALSQRVRTMPIEEYMLATREAIKLAQWFKRALQAHNVDK